MTDPKELALHAVRSALQQVRPDDAGALTITRSTGLVHRPGRLESLGLDSLELLELIMAIEDQIRRELPENVRYSELDIVDDLVALIVDGEIGE